jgi:hypothetical protein
MSLTQDQVEAAKRQYADWIKQQPGMAGFEFQPSHVLILTNKMSPETKAAIQAKLQGVMPVEFYEVGEIKAQTSSAR